jgi:MFS family permease
MSEAINLLREERRARVFFAALTQSSLGTGGGYVALLVIAYQRFHSPWAISLVLLAELLPAMLLGPVFGAASDRWSRRHCMIAADALRAVAFGLIVAVDGFAATFSLALLAGVGTALFTPSSLAALPSLVPRARLPAATSIYGAIADLGFTAGPAVAAAFIAAGGPEFMLIVNAATFAVSVVALAVITFGEAPDSEEAEGAPRRSLLYEARAGLAAVVRMSGIRVVVLASAGALFFGGVFNVAELPFATGSLGVGGAGFALLAAAFGLGFLCGSLAGSRGGESRELKRSFIFGLLAMGAGFALSGVAPVYVVALFTFGLAGFGNGLVLVYERLLIQTTVPDRLMGRVFGAKDALTAWAFGIAFIAAGGAASAVGPRTVISLAGVGCLVVCGVALVALRPGRQETASGGGANPLGNGSGGEQRTHLVGGREDWLAILDDLGQSSDDVRVELRPGVDG